MPWAGGAAEQLVSLDWNRIDRHYKQGDRKGPARGRNPRAYGYVKAEPDPLPHWATGIYTVPVAGGASTYTGCVPEGLGAGRYSLHAGTFAGGALFLSMHANSDDKNTIVKYTVP